MNAELIAVGSELLLGQIANTNAQFISEQLAALGINVYFHTVVGDNAERLKMAVKQAESRADLIIFTGGLGPTKDDLTKETIAEIVGKPLVYDLSALDSIIEYFKKTGRDMTENNRKQALVIEGSQVLENRRGMAPGMIIQAKGRTYILLPGPPSEMRPMYTDFVNPYLSKRYSEHIVSRVLRFFGIGESALETKIIDLIENQTNPTIAPLAKESEVTLRLTAKHQKKEEAERLINETEALIKERVGQYLYGYGDVQLHEIAFQLLKKHNQTLSAAESLTGGLFSKMITDLPGASSVLNGSVICYTNQVKETQVNVPRPLLESEGAVSKACAEAMAKNIRELCGSDLGISFTGVAGPDKSEGKEPGTVYIGLADQNQVKSFKYQFSGTRAAIRAKTAKTGFDLIRRLLLT
ncbi:nicotinamide-nucleotide amidase [Scopulibacillus daqui]|uniref:Putative competence-damage inducible protein n=1 Tax=Scopulibacillus daqui TaxID=1469162 RepID=A0ABS2PWG1_9BACL|nr:competence/damage-inducible protein A [Scopulibacillus daqui]MBM7644413.1 nicotinamide-nucleotide amidase [Scopulibacillus daqui]